MRRKHARFTSILTWCALLCILIGVITTIFVAEKRLSPELRFRDTLENSLIVLMGEYPDRPVSGVGRLLQLLLLVSSTFVFGAIIGKISSLFVTHALRRKESVKEFKDHIIICNWNTRGTHIVKQLLEAGKKHPRDILVISSTAIAATAEMQNQDQVHIVHDDPTHHSTLEKANARKAKAIILLADEESPAPDDKNALTALAIKHLEEESGKEQDIHVIAELLNADRRRHLQEAGADEIVSVQDFSSGIIAQSAIFRNMSNVYQRLLTYSDDTNELYFIESGNYPAAFLGKSFPELCRLVCEHGAATRENPLLLLGIKQEDGTVLLNPKTQTFDKLRQGDALIVMAFQSVERI